MKINSRLFECINEVLRGTKIEPFFIKIDSKFTRQNGRIPVGLRAFLAHLLHIYGETVTLHPRNDGKQIALEPEDFRKPLGFKLLKKPTPELMQITHVVSGIGELFLSQEHSSPITCPEFFGDLDTQMTFENRSQIMTNGSCR